MNDAEKIIEALKRALVEEEMVGLVLGQLQVKTGLSREKVKISLNDLKNEHKIVESDLTTSSNGKTSRKMYVLKEGFDVMKEYFTKEYFTKEYFTKEYFTKEYHDKGSMIRE